MSIILAPPQIPSFLKIGFFGATGTGKTWTATKVLSQFIAEYAKGFQLAMFDTEPSAGYVAPMVKEITGKDLLAVHSRNFADLMDFTNQVRDNGKLVAILDSATHPWRSLMADYLDVKRSRVASANGNKDNVRLSLKDWGPIKDTWSAFSQAYCYDPVHWCINGREGDVWETVTDEEGNENIEKTGVKMKTEVETGYEPSILVQMKLRDGKHYANVVKDRFGVLTGKISGPEPDIEFFRPYIDKLNLGGSHTKMENRNFAIKDSGGQSYEAILARRNGLLENIKDDIVLAIPGMSADDKKNKVKALRDSFGTSSWTELEKDSKKFSIDSLELGREKLKSILKELSNENCK